MKYAAIREDEFDLKKDYQKREKLILEYAPLIEIIARRIARRVPANVRVEDLINCGIIGLLDAIEKFDPSRNVKFRTYVEYRIRGAILDELRAMDWLPRQVREKCKEIEEITQKMEAKMGRFPEDEEVAEAMGVKLEEYQQMLWQIRGISLVSLESLGKNSERDIKNIISCIEDIKAEDPFKSIEFKEIIKMLGELIDDLPQKEKLIISLYYYDELSMKEIGSILELTESRVSQIHSKVVIKLRQQFEKMFSE